MTYWTSCLLGQSGIYINSTATSVTVGLPPRPSSFPLSTAPSPSPSPTATAIAAVRANTVDLATYVCGSGDYGITVTNSASFFTLGAAYVGIGFDGNAVANAQGGIYISDNANDCKIGVEGLTKSGSGTGSSDSAPDVAAFIAGNTLGQVVIRGDRTTIVNVAVGVGSVLKQYSYIQHQMHTGPPMACVRERGYRLVCIGLQIRIPFHFYFYLHLHLYFLFLFLFGCYLYMCFIAGRTERHRATIGMSHYFQRLVLEILAKTLRKKLAQTPPSALTGVRATRS